MIKEMLRKVLRTGKKIAKNLQVDILISKAKKHEMRKYKDQRRVA